MLRRRESRTDVERSLTRLATRWREPTSSWKMSLRGRPRTIRDAVRAICESGITEGGKFVLIAANNMAPCTPVEHVAAIYEAAKEFGRY